LSIDDTALHLFDKSLVVGDGKGPGCQLKAAGNSAIQVSCRQRVLISAIHSLVLSMKRMDMLTVMLDIQIDRARRVEPSYPELWVLFVEIPLDLGEDGDIPVPEEQVDAAHPFGFPRLEQAHEEAVELTVAESALALDLVILPKEVAEGFGLWLDCNRWQAHFVPRQGEEPKVPE
jgi:hypothetical protein